MNHYKEITNLHHSAANLKGKIFGRLTVVAPAERTPEKRIKWLCICDCGAEITALTYNLNNGNTLSCGCLQRERARVAKTTHGMRVSPEYNSWAGLKGRCLNPSDAAYKDYGGRGITVCNRWAESFENFYHDMGPRPSPNHSIERKNNDGGYSPNNCVWATHTQQTNNTRKNVYLVHEGVTLTISQWARVININPGTLWARYKAGWPINDILTKPLRKRSQGANSRRGMYETAA